MICGGDRAQAHPTWPAVTYNVAFRIPHDLADPYERIDAIHWWLKLGSYTKCEHMSAALDHRQFTV